MTATLTVRLNNGAVVVATVRNGQLEARKFVNRTQAERCAATHGGSVARWSGNVFFVLADNDRS